MREPVDILAAALQRLENGLGREAGSGGGGKEIRTPDILLAKQVLYQLSYTPGVHRQVA